MIKEFIFKLFTVLNETSIDYAILRNHKNFPDKPEDSDYYDLDVIVCKRSIHTIENIIKHSISTEQCPFFIKKIVKEYVITYRIIAVDTKLENYLDSVQIDFHVKGQGWWGFYYLNEDEILSKKQRNKDGFFIVSNFHCQLFNWLDKGLWGNYVKEKYSENILLSYKTEKDLWDTFFNKWFNCQHCKYLHSNFSNNDLTSTLSMMPILRRNLIKRSVLNSTFQSLISFSVFLLHEIKQFFLTPGMHLIVSGFGADEVNSFL